MKKLLIFSLVAVFVFSILGLSVGCKTQAVQEAVIEEIEEAVEEAEEEVEEAEEAPEPLKFAIISKGNHPFFSEGGYGMADALEAMGATHIESEYYAPPEWTGESQLKMMEDVIAQGVNGIAVAVTEAGSLTPIINEAMSRGVAVTIWDDDVADSDRICFMGTDNFGAGVLMGELFVEKMDGKAKFIIWVQELTARSVIERVAGIRSVTDQYPDMIELSDEQLAGTGVDTALPVAESLLQTYPDLEATLDVGMNGSIAMHRVMKESGIDPNGIINFTFELFEEVYEGMDEGYIHQTLLQSPYGMGYLSAFALKWYVEDGLRPTQAFIDMDLHFDSGITPVNLDEIETANEKNKARAAASIDEFAELWE